MLTFRRADHRSFSDLIRPILKNSTVFHTILVVNPKPVTFCSMKVEMCNPLCTHRSTGIRQSRFLIYFLRVSMFHEPVTTGRLGRSVREIDFVRVRRH